MASVWEFIKRHKGKLVVGGALAGGVYLAQQYVTEESVRHFRQRFLTSSSSSLSGQDQQPTEPNERLRLQTRRHYIFDSNHRTCDDTILQLLPSLREKIRARFDVEALAERLRTGDFQNEQEKVDVWCEMQNKSLARLVAAAYAFTLLITGLKVQISILAGEIFMNSCRSADRSIMGQLNSLLSPGSGGSTPSPTESDAATQQLFLQCIQYFTTTGLEQLCEKVQTAVDSTTARLSLKDSMTTFGLDSLLREVRGRIEPADMRNMSYFLVPLTAWQDAFATGSDYNRLDVLLRRFKSALELPEARQLTGQFVRRFTTRTIEYCQVHCAAIQEEAGVPVAKLIPALTAAYSSVANDLEFETPVQQILASPDLHDFCVTIFNEKCQ